MSRMNRLVIAGIYTHELLYSAEISWMLLDCTLTRRLRYVIYDAHRGEHHRLTAGMLELAEELNHVPIKQIYLY